MIELAAVATAPTVASPPVSTSPVTSTVAAATTTTVHHSGGHHEAAIALLAIVGILLVLGALVFAVVDRSATEPLWLLRMRHSVGEAGWRVGNLWAEFTDFLRLGR